MWHGVRKVPYGAMKLSPGASKVPYGVRKVSCGDRKVSQKKSINIEGLKNVEEKTQERTLIKKKNIASLQ